MSIFKTIEENERLRKSTLILWLIPFQ